MRLVDVFSTRTACAMLDCLLSHPDKPFLQSWLAEVLGVDPRAVQRAAIRLAALGFITVDARFTAGKVISLRGDTSLGAALLAFHRLLAQAQHPPPSQ
jgi:Mn-dependent DtxR family transcriptional regulator